MQPTSPLPLLVAFQAPLTNAASPAQAATASAQRVEERPQSALAQGSYAWPAWAVVVVALVAIVGALVWWVRVQRPQPVPAPSLGADRAAAKRARS